VPDVLALLSDQMLAANAITIERQAEQASAN
jgi:hypothetical protein